MVVSHFDYPIEKGMVAERNVSTFFLANMRLAVVELERAHWAKSNVVRRAFPKPLYVPEAEEV